MDLRAWIAIPLVIVLAMALPVANGTGLGTITGPVSGAGNQDTGIREWVALMPNGYFLVGRPTRSMIELIVIDASPYPITETHLIVRELAGSNGIRSLLLSAPDELRASIRRVTVYIRGNRNDLVLFERENETWKPRLSQPVSVTPISGISGNKQLHAFSLERLGFYWISYTDSPFSRPNTQSLPKPTAIALLGGNISRGLLPWLLSGLLLILIMSLSHWVHKTEKRRNG